MNPETNLSNAIRLALGSVPTIRLFRNNVAMAWAGSKVIHNPNGSVTIINPRPIHAGLTKGSADLIGWRTMPVTRDMVGAHVARFCSIEVKSKSGRLSADQENWFSVVESHGGIACVARSVDDAIKCLDSPL